MLKRYLLLATCLLGLGSPVCAQNSTALDTTLSPQKLMKVCANSDGTYSYCVQQVNGVTTTVTNSTVTTSGTYQSALAANPSRKGCLITNKGTATLSVYVGAPASATAAQSVILAAGTGTADGGSFNCGLSQGAVLTDQISVTSGTSGEAYNVMAQ